VTAVASTTATQKQCGTAWNAKQAKLVAASNDDASACCASKGKTAQASYVAFGCKKTDRVARAAARAYVELIKELQAYSGAKGCSAQAASLLLTSVLEDGRAQRSAKVTEIEVTPVSLGALSDDAPKKSKKSTCSSSR
jgi:hypothetical protein